MNWTKDDITLVEKLVDIRNRGYYADGKQVTDLYNKVLNKNLPTTNCSSCIRARITELETALKRFKRQAELSGLTTSQLVDEINGIKADLSLSESVTDEAQTTTKEDENKADIKAKMAKVRSHRKVSNK